MLSFTTRSHHKIATSAVDTQAGISSTSARQMTTPCLGLKSHESKVRDLTCQDLAMPQMALTQEHRYRHALAAICYKPPLIFCPLPALAQSIPDEKHAIIATVPTGPTLWSTLDCSSWQRHDCQHHALFRLKLHAGTRTSSMDQPGSTKNEESIKDSMLVIVLA